MHHDFEYCARVHPKHWEEHLSSRKPHFFWDCVVQIGTTITVMMIIINIAVSAMGY